MLLFCRVCSAQRTSARSCHFRYLLYDNYFGILSIEEAESKSAVAIYSLSLVVTGVKTGVSSGGHVPASQRECLRITSYISCQIYF